MKTKYSIVFFLAILLLVICEYVFLSEITEGHRMGVLIATGLGGLFSALAVVFCYMRSGKDVA
ncbi:MAG TPA: hypothetical protein VG870_14730 [Chitinophagaceae bacterium]|nr:hypothetical protein [Chitinophagaceae bacterium]